MQKKARDAQKHEERIITKRQKERRMKKFRIIKLILKVLVLITLLIGLLVYALTSPIFNITEIDVIGNKKFEADEYLSLSELNINENIFNFSKSKSISKIKSNAYVDNVIIKRKLPSKIEIIIEERTPTYLIPLEDNQFAYINNQGYILEISYEKLPLTIITGISTIRENIIEGKRLEDDDLERLQNVIQIKDAMNNIETNKELSSINITNKSNYILIFEKEGKEVQLGNMNNLSSKMLYMKYILNEEGEVPGTIYLNQEQVYFSPK